MRRADTRGFTLGSSAFLVGISQSGKAIQVDVIPLTGQRSVRLWVPISQVHEDSDVYGIDSQGKKQTNGSSGKLIVSHWFGDKPETREEMKGKGVPLHPYGGGS